LAGNVSTQDISTRPSDFVDFFPANGGLITINSRGDITTGNIVSSPLRGIGNGGVITFNATNGNINTGFLESYSLSFSSLFSGNGGAITITAINGSISTDYLKSYSDSFSSFLGGSSSGNGGEISLFATNGITTGDLFSYSGANPGDAGNGSDITVMTTNGNISTGTLYSYSGALNGNASNGGAINVLANNGSIAIGNIDAQAFAGSGAGNGGKITLLARNDITTQVVNNFPSSFGANPSNANRNDITINAGGNIFTESLDTGSVQSNGSKMSLTAGGNITAQELKSFSAQGNSGTIALTAGGNISTEFLDSSSYGNGNGGEITLKAEDSITTIDVISSSNNGNGGAITLTAGSSIHSDYIVSSALAQGNGGAITFTAGGNIGSEYIDSSSFINGNGGEITLKANGSITTTDLISFSTIGNGGALAFTAGGNIRSEYVDSSSQDKGNGGNIAMTAGSTITATSVYTGSVEGNGGNIDLRAIGNISTEYLDSSTERGNGGEITIASDAGAFSVKDAFINTNTFEQGNAGDIRIDAASVSLSNTDVSTTVTGTGDAGDISIVADSTVLLDKSRLFTSVEPGTTGNGGDINIEAKSVSLTNFSYIDTATFGQGNAGNLLIKAEDLVSLDSSSIFSSTTGLGNAGNVTVQARGNSLPPNVTLTNRSNISTAVNPTAQGNGGDISINARSLLIGSGSQIQSRTRGEGNATNTIGRSGNIAIAADAVTISGTQDGFLSGVFTSTDAADSGQGGTINITTPGTLLVTDGGVLSAQTSSTSRGGDISVQANTLELRNGGQLLTSTFSSGQAGDIFVNAAERVTISGIDPNFNNRVSPDNLAASCSIAGIACGTGVNPNVEFSTRIPFVSIPATGTGQANTYTFEVAAGTRAIFDIDNGLKYEGNNTLTQTPQSVDTKIILLDSQGQSLTSSDNESVNLGGGGSIPLRTANSNPPPAFTESNNSNDSYLRYVFTQPGRYSMQVSEGNTQAVKPGGTYTLQVSLDTPNITGSVIDANPASGLFARTQGDGAAGNVTLNTPQLSVSEEASVSASTSGSGQGGSLIVTAPQAITLSGNSQLSVETSHAGVAGNMKISTNTLTVESGAKVTATATATATTTEQGGSISVNASQVNLSGTGGLLAETQGTAPAGSLTLQPFNNGQTLTVNLQDGAKISASSSGSGQGGSLTVTAPQAVTLSGHGKLSAETSGMGEAGDVTINTQQLTVRDGMQVSASTSGIGKGGSLQVNATESVELSSASRLSVEATAGGTAGDLNINTGQMSVSDGANVTVSSPDGQAGNLTITANSLRLDRGTISAETGKSGSEGGANITLQGLDILLMRNESLISANARGTANGGNITIDSRFIVATPPQGPQGSDIVANAFEGNGGRVSITTQGLFGIQFRPQRTPKNDITVSSALGLAGTFEQNTPDVDPSRGLAELPVDVVDASRLIDRHCSAGGSTQERGSFTITGRGGLPPSPNDTLQAESLITNWVTLDSQQDKNRSPAPTMPNSSAAKPLTEAQGWMINEKGEVVLTASASQVTPQGKWLPTPECNPPQTVTLPQF
jgi:large exoprotein involved in heme utilization and adhesion